MIRRALLLAIALGLFAPACAGGGSDVSFGSGVRPECSQPNESLILLAQTVEGSTLLPCITGFPAGWSYGGDDFRSGSATYWLSSAIAGDRAIEVGLLPSCEPQGEPYAVERATGAEGYVSTDAAGETRSFVFDGGCIVQRIALPEGTDAQLVEQARGTLGFLSREMLAAELERDYGVTLCGAGAAPCIG